MKTRITKADKDKFKHSLKKELFWDIDFEKMDVDIASRLVIERISTEGSLREFRLLVDYYGEKTIAEKVVKIGFLDKKTLAYLSLILNIPKNKFRCYTTQQSNPKSWNY